MCWQFSEPQFLHLCNGIPVHIMCPGLLTHSRCLANGNYFTLLLRFEKRGDEVSALNPTLQRTQGLSRPQHSQASSPWGIRMPASTLSTARGRATLWPPASPGHLAVTSPPHLRQPRPGLHRLCFLSLAQLLPVTADRLGEGPCPHSREGGNACLLEASGDYIWIILLIQRKCLQMADRGDAHASLCLPLDCHSESEHPQCSFSSSTRQLAIPA